MDELVRVGVLLLGGLALAGAVAWYFHFLYQEVTGTGNVVIDPLTVVTSEGKGDDELGKVLAQTLQSRLESLTSQLQSAQEGLKAEPSPDSTLAPGNIGDVRSYAAEAMLLSHDNGFRVGLLQPVELKLSVAGVEVGGVLPWIQRRLSNRRTLHFTVYSHGDQTQVFGSIAALGLSDDGVRLSPRGAGGGAPRMDEVIDQLAHEILRHWMAKDPSNRVELLRPEEFVTLVSTLVKAADANRFAVRGRQVQKSFAELLAPISALADQVPDWPELGYLTAWVADRAGDCQNALTYFDRVLPSFTKRKQDKIAATISARITALSQSCGKEQQQNSVDHSNDIVYVHDTGPEGAVVGHALAAILETQITNRTKIQTRISSRYIYYAARELEGTTSSDSGAQISDGIKVLIDKGAFEESVWPYKPGEYASKPPPAVEKAKRYRITEAKPLKNLNAIKAALKDGPVVAGITMFESSMTPEVSRTGEIPLPTAKSRIIGGHAIVIVGYDDQHERVTFLNSWGTSWGNKGFGYLPYAYLNDKNMSDAWSFKPVLP